MKDIVDLQGFIREAETIHNEWRQDAKEWVKMERGDQWDEEDKTRLESENRPVLTFNIIRPFIRLLTGIERKTRYDIKVLPVGEGSDNEVARFLTNVIKKIEDDNNAQYVYTEAYHSGLDTGRGWIKVDVSYDRNVYGDIILEEVDSYEILVDPYTRKYDLSDCHYLIRELFLTKDDVLETYPDVDSDKLETAQPDYGDNISSGRVCYKFYEIWYKEYKEHWYLVNKETGDIFEIDQKKRREIEENMTEETNFELRKILRPEIYYAVISGNEVLEQGPSPYGHNYFPYVPFFCDFRPRFGYEEKPTWHSVITDLVDPQKEKNKRISLWVDIMLRFINKGVRYAEGAIRNPDALDDMAKASGYRIIMDPAKFNQFEIIHGVAPDASLLNYASLQDQEIFRISGVPPTLYGMQETSRESGRSIYLRQQQGFAILAPFQDNMRLTRKIVASQILALIPRVYTIQRLVRLMVETENGNPVLTPENIEKLKVIYKVKLDPSILLYDVSISESPSTPTTRQAEFMEMLELLKEGFLPITPNIIKLILKTSDISLKNELMSILEAEMQKQQEQAQSQQIQKAVLGLK